MISVVLMFASPAPGSYQLHWQLGGSSLCKTAPLSSVLFQKIENVIIFLDFLDSRRAKEITHISLLELLNGNFQTTQISGVVA